MGEDETVAGVGAGAGAVAAAPPPPVESVGRCRCRCRKSPPPPPPSRLSLRQPGARKKSSEPSETRTRRTRFFRGIFFGGGEKGRKGERRVERVFSFLICCCVWEKKQRRCHGGRTGDRMGGGRTRGGDEGGDLIRVERAFLTLLFLRSLSLSPSSSPSTSTSTYTYTYTYTSTSLSKTDEYPSLLSQQNLKKYLPFPALYHHKTFSNFSRRKRRFGVLPYPGTRK